MNEGCSETHILYLWLNMWLRFGFLCPPPLPFLHNGNRLILDQQVKRTLEMEGRGRNIEKWKLFKDMRRREVFGRKNNLKYMTFFTVSGITYLAVLRIYVLFWRVKGAYVYLLVVSFIHQHYAVKMAGICLPFFRINIVFLSFFWMTIRKTESATI